MIDNPRLPALVGKGRLPLVAAKARLWALVGGALAAIGFAAPAPADPSHAAAPADTTLLPAAPGPAAPKPQPSAPAGPEASATKPSAPAPADSARPAPAVRPAAPKSAAKGNIADTSRPAFRFVPPAFTRQDSLFIAAATGEPRFQAIRDSSEKILVEEDTATLDYLIAHRLIDQTPRQRHYVETLFKAISDSGRHPAAAARLGAALALAPDSLKPQLLHIGSEVGDSSFLKIARRYLEHDSEEVRKNAVRSLGAYPSPANAAWLVAGLDRTQGLERAERLWALGKQKDFKEWPRVLPYLKDPNLYNRELARRIVAASCGDWTRVEPLAPPDMGDDELLEWILMADESPGLAAKIWVRRHVPQLSPARMKFIGSALRLQ